MDNVKDECFFFVVLYIHIEKQRGGTKEKFDFIPSDKFVILDNEIFGN